MIEDYQLSQQRKELIYHRDKFWLWWYKLLCFLIFWQNRRNKIDSKADEN